MNPQLNADDTAGISAPATPTPATPNDRPPDWWHRDHPTFTALAGFFSGLLFVIVVPGAFAAILAPALRRRGRGPVPVRAGALVVPIALMVVPRTRRFGIYLLLGMVLTALVVLGVAAARALVHVPVQATVSPAAGPVG